MAAVLAYGVSAVLSHRSAAALWRMSRSTRAKPSVGREDETVTDVTVTGHGGRARKLGIRVHRSITLQPRDRTRRAGIPVTTPGRTLEDLRRIGSRDEFHAALKEAEFLGLPIGGSLAPDGTRSELESRLLALCRRHRLPPPEVNVRVGRFVVDFLWRRRRLVVEVDGWESHRTRSAFEADRARDAELKVLGYEVVRFTWRQVTSDPAHVARAITALLCS